MRREVVKMEFEEQFPSLKTLKLVVPESMKDDYGKQIIVAFYEQDFKQHCLDKQKVRDAIIKFRDNIFETGEMTKEDRAKLTIKFDILNDELGL